MQKLKLIEDKVAFRFLEDVDNSGFSGKTESGLLVKRSDDNQVNTPRWGTVLKCADDVTEVKEGDYILIEPLGWTTALEFEEISDDSFWITTEAKIMAVSDEEPKIL
jgi:hypothetical protein